ncbi:CotH kinase family protein [Paenibacillus sp. FJAT-26967]|uniref:CotH kinase family protein n=1 Tax=Paenibacillus sp. FJAT-26967 TaxID=1729690 RepID=UPI0008386A2D|nr:CotH kinase family protein [Paenibacillus sp. FJAT-26967]
MSLPKFHITMGTEEKQQLSRNIWSRQFVKASLSDGRSTTPIQIRYRGGHTREYAKKSYEIRLKGKTYHLNAEYDDPSLIRNALSFRYFQMIGVPSPHTRHIVIWINGRSEGIYLLIEAVKRSFFRRRGIIARSLMYASNDSAGFSLIDPETGKPKRSLFEGYNLIKGSVEDRTRLKLFIRSLNTFKGERLQRLLTKRIDVNNYLRWLAGAVMTGNYDGFEHNYAIYEHKATRRYRMIPWDYEGSWGRNCYGKLVGSDLVRITGYNTLTRKLLSYPAIRKQYQTVLSNLLETSFTSDAIMPIVHRLHSRLIPDIYEDRSRKWPASVFESEPGVIKKYIEDRRKDLKEGLRSL